MFRVEEIAGRSGAVTISFPQWQVEAVNETNLIEEELREIALDGMALDIALRPKEIRTFKVVVRSDAHDPVQPS